MASRTLTPLIRGYRFAVYYIAWCACALLLVGITSGCQVLAPIPIESRNQYIAPELIDTERSQIEVGKSHRFIDGFGWLVGIPGKILLWDRRVDNHKISEQTILTLADYLEQNNLPHVKVRANQYAPIEEWKRLTKNKTVAWPWRYTFGALSVAGEAVYPGRIFGGDHFNPFTQTVHLYSDIPAIALHEGGHAKDFTRRKYQGSYGAAYLILPMWHETIASQDVFAYLRDHPDPQRMAEANRILYPAYGTYFGGSLGNLMPDYALPLYYGSVLAGHINGRMLNRNLDLQPSRRITFASTRSEPSEELNLESVVPVDFQTLDSEPSFTQEIESLAFDEKIFGLER